MATCGRGKGCVEKGEERPLKLGVEVASSQVESNCLYYELDSKHLRMGKLKLEALVIMHPFSL